MRIAEQVALRGTCSRLSVGAVISLDSRVVSTGYNGAPAGMSHCVHEEDSPCTVSVHAEANALIFAARHGGGLEMNGERPVMYTTHQPCRSCAALMINARIGRVLYRHAYRDDGSTDMLRQAGVEMIRLG